jgi:CRISPR-associated protein Cst2
MNKQKPIRSITVTARAVMRNHMANLGEKQLGNLSGIKRRPDGRVYISGQKQKHAFFAALNRLNDDSKWNGKNTMVANGDGVPGDLVKDLRSDLGGYMLPKKKGEGKSKRRRAPVSATFATAIEPSDVGLDLLLRLLNNADADLDKQALASREYSQSDEMEFSFNIQTEMVGVTVEPVYEDNAHVRNQIVHHIDREEKVRRIKLALEATRFLNDYANSARNMTSAEPVEVYIALDTVLSRGAANFFSPGVTDQERENVKKAILARGGEVIHGDNRKEFGVEDAYRFALETLDKRGVLLYEA